MTDSTFVPGSGQTPPRVCQLGIVVPDLTKAIDNYRALGIGPWERHSMNDQTLEYYYVDDKKVTEPFEFQIAIGYMDAMQIELMTPIKGPNLYKSFLDKCGGGLHHIKEYIPDEKIEEVADSYRKRGIKVLAYGKFGQDKFFYLDTQEMLGTLLELGNYRECPPPTSVVPL